MDMHRICTTYVVENTPVSFAAWMSAAAPAAAQTLTKMKQFGSGETQATCLSLYPSWGWQFCLVESLQPESSIVLLMSTVAEICLIADGC